MDGADCKICMDGADCKICMDGADCKVLMDGADCKVLMDGADCKTCMDGADCKICMDGADCKVLMDGADCIRLRVCLYKCHPRRNAFEIDRRLKVGSMWRLEKLKGNVRLLGASMGTCACLCDLRMKTKHYFSNGLLSTAE